MVIAVAMIFNFLGKILCEFISLNLLLVDGRAQFSDGGTCRGLVRRKDCVLFLLAHCGTGQERSRDREDGNMCKTGGGWVGGLLTSRISAHLINIILGFFVMMCSVCVCACVCVCLTVFFFISCVLSMFNTMLLPFHDSEHPYCTTFHTNLVHCVMCVHKCVCACSACVFVSVVVMCVTNEPTPKNMPCVCYLAKITFLCLLSYS